MTCRCLASTGAVATVIAVVSLVWASAAGQSPTGAATSQTTQSTTWTPPVTPWGEPDLQGVWSYEATIPFERPAVLAGKESLTSAEVAAREKAERDALAKRLAGADFTEIGRRADSPIAGNEYNQFWFELGRPKQVSARTSLIVDPPDRRMPLTAEQRQRKAYQQQLVSSRPPKEYVNNSWLDRDTGERCLTDGLPGNIWMGNNNAFTQITQGPGYVVIIVETQRDRRIIPTDGRPHGYVRRWLGESRGHWEGSTLVVDTTNFADKTHYLWQDHWRASSPTMHLSERITRVGPDTLDYRLTITDPSKFTRPWSVQVPVIRRDTPLYEYACHEGNYAMVHLLSEARNLEKQESAKKRQGKE